MVAVWMTAKKASRIKYDLTWHISSRLRT